MSIPLTIDQLSNFEEFRNFIDVVDWFKKMDSQKYLIYQNF